MHICLNWRYRIPAPHPSTSLPPSPEGEGFVDDFNAYYRRGELCSPVFCFDIVAELGRTQFAITVGNVIIIVIFIHIQ